jgi:hypothetical protein
MSYQPDVKDLCNHCQSERRIIEECLFRLYPASMNEGRTLPSSKGQPRASKLDPHFEFVAMCVFQRAHAQERGVDLDKHTLERISEKLSKQIGVRISASGLSRFLTNHPVLKEIAQWS